MKLTNYSIPELVLLTNGMLIKDVQHIQNMRNTQLTFNAANNVVKLDRGPKSEVICNTISTILNNDKVQGFFADKSLRYFIEIYDKKGDTLLIPTVYINDAGTIVMGIVYLYNLIRKNQDVIYHYKGNDLDLIGDIIYTLLQREDTSLPLLTLMQGKGKQVTNFITTNSVVNYVKLHDSLRSNVATGLNNEDYYYSLKNITPIKDTFWVSFQIPYLHIDKIIKGILYEYSIIVYKNYTNNQDGVGYTSTADAYNKYVNYSSSYDGRNYYYNPTNYAGYSGYTVLDTTTKYPKFIENICKHLEQSETDVLIIGVDDKAYSVKDMFSNLLVDVQSFNCLAPDHKLYNECVTRRTSKEPIKTYTMDDLKTSYEKGYKQAVREVGDILNFRNLSDELYDLYKQSKANSKLEDEEYQTKINGYKETIKASINKLYKTMYDVVIGRKDYMNKFNICGDADYIDSLYTEDKSDDKLEHIDVNRIYERDMEDITRIFKDITTHIIEQLDKSVAVVDMDK